LRLPIIWIVDVDVKIPADNNLAAIGGNSFKQADQFLVEKVIDLVGGR